MKKILTIFLTIIIEIAVLLLAFYAGILLQSKKTALKFEAATKIIETINSKIIPNITATGIVTNILNRNITLTSGDENLVVSIPKDTIIYSFVFPKTVEDETNLNNPTLQTVKFTDIKIGDTLNVNLKIFPNGEVRGINVIIRPQLTKP